MSVAAPVGMTGRLCIGITGCFQLELLVGFRLEQLVVLSGICTFLRLKDAGQEKRGYGANLMKVFSIKNNSCYRALHKP